MPSKGNSEVEIALDLVGRIYEAAVEPELWQPFLNTLADATACDGTIIFLHDSHDESARLNDANASFISNVRFEPEYLKSYAEYYTHRNVLLKSVDSLPEGSVMNSSRVISDENLRATEYYNDWLRPQGVGYCLGGPVLKRGSTVSMLSLSRAARHGPFTPQEVRLTQTLMPHLRRACLLHQRLTRLRAERVGGLAALELLPTAVWLLDPTGRLLFANRAGRELDECHDGLWINRDGRPTATEAEDHHRLQRIISEAIAAGQGCGSASSGALKVRRRGQAEALQVMLYPLGQAAFVTGSAAAMFIFDPAKTVVPDGDLLRLFYGLTPAEARLACALAQGSTVAEYGALHQLAANTVRTHLKHALSKTGTHQQSQLVRLVVNLPTVRRQET